MELFGVVAARRRRWCSKGMRAACVWWERNGLISPSAGRREAWTAALLSAGRTISTPRRLTDLGSVIARVELKAACDRQARVVAANQPDAERLAYLSNTAASPS